MNAQRTSHDNTSCGVTIYLKEGTLCTEDLSKEGDEDQVILGET